MEQECCVTRGVIYETRVASDDFHKGAGRKRFACENRMTDARLTGGVNLVAPKSGADGGALAPERKDERYCADAVKLTRLDVVAHGWGIERHPREDEEHLATRIGRAAVSVPKTIRPAIPPIEWEPPKAYKLGDPWISTHPTNATD